MKLKHIMALIVTALFIFGCDKKPDENTIRIATKPMTEQLILGETLGILIKTHTPLEVKITKGIGGGTSNIHPALLKDEFDLYPEYTGTAWRFVLNKETLPDDKTLFTELNKEYQQKFALEWVGLYGFNNTFGLVVRQDIADKHHLKTYSDLAPFSPQFTFGAEYDFYERDDGYEALVKTYGFEFANHIDLDLGLKYQAIKDHKIDVMNVFTTDGQLSSTSVALLTDDKHFYPTYYCGTVVRSDTLKKHPQLRDALMMMNNLITEKEMSQMNHAVEIDGRDEHDVALAFLRAKGLIA